MRNVDSTTVRTEAAQAVKHRATVIPGTRLAPWVFITPFFVLQAMWVLGPAVYAVWLSMHQDLNGMTGPFNGLDNYARVAGSDSFGTSVSHIVTFLVISGPIFLLGATLIALLIDSGAGWGRSIARVVMYLPFTLPPTVAVILWAFNYSPDASVFGPILHLLGVKNAIDLGTPDNLPRAISNLVLWQNLGAWIVLLTATLGGIPDEIIEMARTEGAGAWALIRYIKLPLIVPTMVLMLISVSQYMVTLYTEPVLLGSTLQVDATYTPNMWIGNLASQGFFSQAAAAMLILAVILPFTIAVILPFTIAVSVRSGFYSIQDSN